MAAAHLYLASRLGLRRPARGGEHGVNMRMHTSRQRGGAHGDRYSVTRADPTEDETGS